ncbi:MAG: penicillin-binding protein [Bacteroidales bacterium]|nr:penicillin-binding protein [Candidatus Sodaliphilus aphodohippi]
MRRKRSDSWSWLSSLFSGISTRWHRFKVWYKGLYKGKPWYIRTAVAIATFFVCLILYLIAVDINLLWLFGKSPSTYSIMHPPLREASYVYSADGVEIGKYYDENRTPVKLKEINPMFFKLLIDTEDERFYSHHGVDYGGMLAALKDMVVHGHPRGASTITQQLVKNMFQMRNNKEYSKGLLGYIPGVKMLIMKSKEWILATKIEIFYDKDEILEMYANTVDFGSNAYGIKTAAKTYFNTTPLNLKTQDCAVLVGLLKATSTYSPIINPKNCIARRNTVLMNAVNHGDLSQEEYKRLSSETGIGLHLSFEKENSGIAPYFRQAVADELSTWCEKTGHDLNTDGLKIYTTLDSRLQRHAESAVSTQMRRVQQNFRSHWGTQDCWLDDKGEPIANFVEDKERNTDVYKQLLARFPTDLDSVNYYMNLPHRVHLFDYDNKDLYMTMSSRDSIRYMLHFLHTGFVAMDPSNGHVKAWVGDVDFDTWKFDKVNHPHQPGSTFKLFVYAAAMERGMTPCSRRRDQYFDTLVLNKETSALEHWHPTNANGHFSGADMTLRSAFAQSINSVAVRVGLDVGLPEVATTAHDMGISSELDEEPAMTLGSCDVLLHELVGAYCAVVNDGHHHSPVLVERIVDRDGNEIYHAPNDDHQALSYRSAFLMRQMLLAGTHDAGGTSMAINSFITPSMYDTDFGGKTGTSNRHADAWFVGVTPHLVAGAWVGGEYRQIHFRSGAMGQGSKTALPICGEFFKLVFNDPNFRSLHGRFAQPREYIDPAAYEGCAAGYEPDTIMVGDSLLSDSAIDAELRAANELIEETQRNNKDIEKQVSGAFKNGSDTTKLQ